MKTFLIFVFLLLSIIGTSQVYTVSGNYTYGLSIFTLDNTSFTDLRKERRFTDGYSYGFSIGKYFEKGYYQNKFWGVKLEINKFQYNQDIRLVPELVSLQSLKYIEKRIELNGYSFTPLICYHPSIGQSVFFELGPSYNHISSNREFTKYNDIGYDVPLTPYEFRKNFLSLYLRMGVYFNFSDWIGLTTSLCSKTNVTPVTKDNIFNSYFFGGDIGLTFRIKK